MVEGDAERFLDGLEGAADDETRCCPACGAAAAAAWGAAAAAAGFLSVSELVDVARARLNIANCDAKDDMEALLRR